MVIESYKNGIVNSFPIGRIDLRKFLKINNILPIRNHIIKNSLKL